jgi:hypothetical protein
MKSIRQRIKKPFDRKTNPRFVEYGKPYKDSKGQIYQTYVNGMVRRLTEAPVASTPTV